MPTSSTRLVVLDIDGTLLPPGAHHQDVPDAKITNAISVLMANGVEVALASGRMFPGTALIGKHLNLTLPLICQQGASVHNLDGSVKCQLPLDSTIAHELVSFAQAEGLSYSWFDAQRYLISEHTEASKYFAEVSGIALELHNAPETSGIVPTGVDIISCPDQAPAIYDQLDARYGERVHLLDFKTVTVAHAPEASKGKAVAALAANLGIAQADVLTIGDSVNDASMLLWAGHSAAPAHCDDYARAAAKEILPGDGVDGVAQLLQTVATRVSAG